MMWSTLLPFIVSALAKVIGSKLADLIGKYLPKEGPIAVGVTAAPDVMKAYILEALNSAIDSINRPILGKILKALVATFAESILDSVWDSLFQAKYVVQPLSAFAPLLKAEAGDNPTALLIEAAELAAE